MILTWRIAIDAEAVAGNLSSYILHKQRNIIRTLAFRLRTLVSLKRLEDFLLDDEDPLVSLFRVPCFEMPLLVVQRHDVEFKAIGI